MAFTIEKLRTTTDDELIAIHDELARHTVVGTEYYMDELRRRDQMRAIESSHRLAVASFVLTAVSTATAIIAIVIALTG